MTHNEKRTHWVKEGAIGLSTGILFGLTNVVVGHVSQNIQFKYYFETMKESFYYQKPFDTIKTKMQAQKGYENLSMIKSFRSVLIRDGLRGLYR